MKPKIPRAPSDITTVTRTPEARSRGKDIARDSTTVDSIGRAHGMETGSVLDILISRAVAMSRHMDSSDSSAAAHIMSPLPSNEIPRSSWGKKK